MSGDQEIKRLGDKENSKIMNLKKGLIGFSVAFGWLLLLSQLSCAQTVYSFTSWDFPAHYIRHQGLKGFIHEISDDLGKKDATFRYVPGLAGNVVHLNPSTIRTIF